MVLKSGSESRILLYFENILPEGLEIIEAFFYIRKDEMSNEKDFNFNKNQYIIANYIEYLREIN